MLHRFRIILFSLCLLPLQQSFGASQGADAKKGGGQRGKGKTTTSEINSVLEDFNLKNVNGKTVKLSDFRGKSIFVLELGACT